MRYAQVRAGRVFVIRLEQGEIVHEKLEEFAAAHGISAAWVVVVGGVDKGSRLVVGPERGDTLPVDPMERVLEGVHEAAGVGTIFPDENGESVLHLHLSCGRKDTAKTGCARKGVVTWHILEVIVQELSGFQGCRKRDSATGFALLQP
jgi:predicted DNA-binding protein with PD1-like motif